MMVKKRRYTILLLLLLIMACVPTQQKRDMKSNSFRSVPAELSGVNWRITPIDVLKNPKEEEPLIWLGIVKNVYIKEYPKENKIELEWLCEHLNFAEPGPDAISVRPIKARTGEGFFSLSVISENMTIEQARNFQTEHTATQHFMLAGGKLSGFVDRDGKRVPFLYTYRFGLGPDLAIIEK